MKKRDILHYDTSLMIIHLYSKKFLLRKKVKFFRSMISQIDFRLFFSFFFRNLKFNENEETKPTNRKGSKLFKLNHERKCDETRESKQLEENKKMCYLVLYIFQF